MKDFNIEERVKLATELFAEGYNCAQSVFLAYADLFGIEENLSERLSISFGGGIGRMREVCGTVSAMTMLAGLKHPAKPNDQEARTRNYTIVQQMANEFKTKHNSLICRNLLPESEAAKRTPTPSERTPQYYASRPCSKYVADAARIAGKMLKEEAISL